MKNLLLCMLGMCLFQSVLAQQKDTVDLLVDNGKIYTVDSAFSIHEAMVVHKGKVVYAGAKDVVQQRFYASRHLDLNGAFVYPGFIDAHCHFLGYAKTLLQVNLSGTKSWDEVIDKVVNFAAQNPEGWINARGWDQNDWDKKEFPTNDTLNKLFPDRPVILRRVDGHAAIANGAALKAAGITKKTKIEGGEIVKKKRKKLTGLLIDNAVDLVINKIPPLPDSTLSKLLHKAETTCLSLGLTSVVDCGIDGADIELLEREYQQGNLAIRMYAMLSDKADNFAWLAKRGVIQNEQLHVRSFKVYADGALGSRGACLLKPYADRADWRGFLLSPGTHFDSVAEVIYNKGWQMCTHAIGDSSNRTMLDVYAKYLKGKNDRRWRIEHAQVIDSADFNRFGAFSIVPSVQPTHATSDMYWAGDRLGSERIKNAYAYQQLLQQNGWMPLGTDFPVEQIDPLLTFYAAVARKDAHNFPAEGFQKENDLSREQALRGMTIWAARGSFEENIKGSLEPGKLADFIILNKDLMTTPEQELNSIQVLKTYVGGILRIEKRAVQKQ